MNYREYKNKSQVIWVCILLTFVTIVVYWQVVNHDFINFDDDLYVTRNPYVRDGLTLKGILWAFNFKSKEETYWHPLTWLSHMVDCQLFGLRPGFHHLTNLFFHIVNTLLLFLVLKRMTGKLWRSAFVAGLFALHPLNVDSVAWIAERKNVLSALFWMLTLFQYCRYAERPGTYRYLITFIFFALGLMAKPMLVTLPFVLLLLDYWPMDRIKISALSNNTDKKKDASSYRVFERFSPLQVIAEKVPFLILSIFSVSLSSLSVKGLGTVISTEKISMGLRIENALVSYVKYIGDLFWPENLAIFYPYPKTVPVWQTSGAIVLLGCGSIFVVRTIKEKPYLAIGWFWFLGTFVPVIGLVQVGLWPAMADRFTYIPLIGLFVLIAWGVYDLTAKWHYRKIRLGILSLTILSISLGLTWGQLHHWKNSISLFKQTLAVTDENYVIHYNMGVVLGKADNTAAAADHYLDAIKINPRFLRSYNNLGNIFAKKGKTSEAIRYFNVALKIKPESADIHNNLGLTLAESGQVTEAVQHFSEALRINPNFGEALYNMGNALAQQGHPSEAIRYFSKALEINPDNAKVHNNLGIVLTDQGETALAIKHYSQALAVKPDFAEAHYNMANALANQGLTKESVEHYEKALDIHPQFIPALNNLAMIYAVSGKNDKALTLMKRLVDYQPEQAETYYNIACIYARQNKRDQAIDWFQKAVKRGYSNWDLIKTDRDLENIRDTFIYKELIEDH